MTATEVSRNFSAVINRVAAGEEIEIVRNGATVAELRRPPRPRRLAGEAWWAFIAGLPAVDEDFARDVEAARESVGPPVSRWPARSIDTSVLVGAERGGGTLGQVPAEEEHAISAITASALLHGVHRAADGAHRTRRRAFVESVLAELETLPVTLEIARVHAEIWAQLQAAGRVIGAHDLWIAATAITHDLRIATCNPGEFERVPGLSVLGV